MINIEKFGKVTHDNLPQAVEHLINMMSVQVEQQTESDSSPYLDSDDEIDIKQASVLLKKSQSTIYRYTCNRIIPFYKIGNRLRFSKTELLEWKKFQNTQDMGDKGI
ncbi:helix-turn-helix domain-containing protein [uncultured Bacteroides sp.]|uniref:helix-turn-helix domain-containing protein n=1 Tax=uncultured Bacteroides sp. TaxID=162156 RepID=UPI002597F3F1|nr:helix-turn-helix domain-containing protein [uncultured Bacteroides sp.]